MHNLVMFCKPKMTSSKPELAAFDLTLSHVAPMFCQGHATGIVVSSAMCIAILSHAAWFSNSLCAVMLMLEARHSSEGAVAVLLKLFSQVLFHTSCRHHQTAPLGCKLHRLLAVP